MDNSLTNCPPGPAPGLEPGTALLDELARLAPALEGFPVGQLLDVFIDAEQRDRDHAYQLVDRCLVHWIASLEGSLHAYPHAPDDALLRVQARQLGARDALSTLKTALSRMDLVHRNRGQVC